MKLLTELDSLDNVKDGETRILPTKVSQLQNDSGYITGITDNDVVDALGYTPEAEPSIYRLSSIRQITSTDDETYIHLTNDMDNGTPIIINTGTGGCNVIGTRTTLSGISRSLWFMTSDNYYGKITFTKSGTSVTVTIEDIDIPTATSDLTNDSNFAVTNADNNFSSSQSITGDLTVSGTAQIQNGLYCRPTGQVNTPVGNSMLVVKRASQSEDSTPNNGVVLEFGNSTSWAGQLYIGDNATQGIYYNGWSNGVRGSWIKLASQNDLQPVTLWEGSFAATSTTSINWTQSKYDFDTLRIAYRLDNWGASNVQFKDIPNIKNGMNSTCLDIIYGYNSSRQQIRSAVLNIYEKSASWDSARIQYRELSTSAVTGGGNATSGGTITIVGIYGIGGSSAVSTPINETDTGWISIIPSTGTWTSLRYRVIGKLVQVEGYASSLSVSNGSAGVVGAVPEEYMPSLSTYGIATGASAWIGRANINTVNGNISIDAARTVSGAYTGSGYCGFNIMYFID